MPSTMSSDQVKKLQDDWEKQRAAKFLEEKVNAFKAKPDLVEPADLEALFRDVKSDVDLEREKEFVLAQVAKGKSLTG